MAKIVIEGTPPFDGSYELDPTRLTNRDYHTIKVVAGLRANELQEALEAGDLDLIVALAACALYRAGYKGKEVVERLWDSEFGKITVVGDEVEEDDASPPAQTPPVSESVSGESNGASGDSSSLAGGHPESLLNPTGQATSEPAAT